MMKQQAATTKQRVRGVPFKPGVSGNPLGRRVVGLRFKEAFDGFAEGLGGVEKMTRFQSEMLARAVRMWLRAERTRDVRTQLSLTRCATRLLAAAQSGKADPRGKKPTPPPDEFRLQPFFPTEGSL
jgi:hypothetical protein